jgi:hypothetical protein
MQFLPQREKSVSIIKQIIQFFREIIDIYWESLTKHINGSVGETQFHMLRKMVHVITTGLLQGQYVSTPHL